jgi:hypothetical protein
MDTASALEDWLKTEPLEDDESVVIVNNEIFNAAQQAVVAGDLNRPIPASMRLFSRKVRLLCEVDMEDGSLHTTRNFLARMNDGSVRVWSYGVRKHYMDLGVLRPGDLFVYPTIDCGYPLDTLAGLLTLAAEIICLLGTPRFVTQLPLPRHVRRGLDRKSGVNVSDRVRVVSWNLTKPKLEAGESLGSGRHMPLHYTRGHWRQCVAHLDRAHLHADGVHRMWIEGFWSGHPAYGIVRSIHAPKL